MDIKHECKTSLGKKKKKKKSFYEYGCSMKEDIDENSKDRFEDMQLFEDFGSGQRKNIIYISDAKIGLRKYYISRVYITAIATLYITKLMISIGHTLYSNPHKM